MSFMPFLQLVYESAYEAVELIWVDLATLMACFLFYVLGVLVFRKDAKSKIASDGLLDRLRNVGIVAMSAIGIRKQLPLRRHKGPAGNPAGRLAHAGSAVEADHSQESILCAIRDAQNRGAWDTVVGLLKEMQQQGFEIPQGIAARVFRDQSPAEVCASLRRLREAGVTLQLSMYNCALGICVQAGDLQRAQKLNRELRVATAGPDIVTFTSLLKSCQASGDLHVAKEILQEMTTAGLRPNEQSYNTFINTAVTKGDFPIAWDIIEMRKQAGVPVDRYLVSIMMKTIRQRDSRQPLASRHVPRVFEFLDESGVDFCSDEVLLSTVVDACVWHREFSRVERILESYLTSRLVPTVPVYPSLIKASKCIKRMDLVWRLWREVVEDRELEPSVILIGCMLDALVCNDCLDKAFELFQEWKTRVPPTTVVYSTLTKGLLGTHQVHRAYDLLTEMRAEGVPRNTVLYNQIIGGLASQGDLDKVNELMHSMIEDGCTPDVITYSVVVKRYCVIADFEAVRRILRQAQQRGIILDMIVYSSIFYGCFKHKRHELVDEFVEHMRPYGLAPSSFTLSIIVKMYGGQGQLGRAFEVAEMLSPQSARRDSRVMASLLGQCVANSDLDRAEPLSQALLAMDGPDAKTFWSLVILYVRCGELQRAQAAIGMWRPKNAAKDARVDRLVHSLQGCRESQSLALLNELRKEATSPSRDEE